MIHSNHLSPKKARKMLHEGKAQGHALTKKQRGYFGLVASGKKPTRMRKSRRVPSYRVFRENP